MSPERLKGEKYDAAGDVWSVGITIIELWEKRYPFLHVADTPISLLGELERVSFSRLLSRSAVGYSAQMKDFILATLEADPRRRPGAADLMGSPWFEITGTNNLVDAQAVRRNHLYWILLRSRFLCVFLPRIFFMLLGGGPLGQFPRSQGRQAWPFLFFLVSPWEHPPWPACGHGPARPQRRQRDEYLHGVLAVLGRHYCGRWGRGGEHGHERVAVDYPLGRRPEHLAGSDAALQQPFHLLGQLQLQQRELLRGE